MIARSKANNLSVYRRGRSKVTISGISVMNALHAQIALELSRQLVFGLQFTGGGDLVKQQHRIDTESRASTGA